ncbi:MAG: GNAT family N-acetyltransferase [Chloroflexi bacterium]|nr:GNAT family N-acetyltransferase [Chloroflexota bacterium]
MPEIKTRPTTESDRPWMEQLSRDAWGSEVVIAHGELYKPAKLNGIIAEVDGKKAGLVTYQIKDKSCEIITLNALRPGLGIGSLLISQMIEIAKQEGYKRLWLITTNDNTRALRFWQKKGFHLSALRVGAINEYRKIKPEIPTMGEDGILIRDEIELEMRL